MVTAGLIAVVVWAGSPRAQEGPADKYEIVTPKDDNIEATAINSRGDVVGFEWAEEKDNADIISQKPFFARGKAMTYLPLLKGYTATFPAAASDDGLVVGRVSKPAPPGVRVYMRNQAFLWDAKNGIRGLGALKDDHASFACGISRDGKRISGYSVGDDRLRACVWDLDRETWKATPLPQESPKLTSLIVAMSDDGKRVSAVDGTVPCLWSRNDTGEWKREPMGGIGAIVPRAVNNAGTVVGIRFYLDGHTDAVVWKREDGAKPIELPKGYERGEANAVNNQGVVVGMMDGPRGSKTGPQAFAYRAGKMRFLAEGGPLFTTATGINDNGQITGIFEQDDHPPGQAKPKP
jgi:uncharacterized membrane protein